MLVDRFHKRRENIVDFPLKCIVFNCVSHIFVDSNLYALSFL